RALLLALHLELFRLLGGQSDPSRLQLLLDRRSIPLPLARELRHHVHVPDPEHRQERKASEHERPENGAVDRRLELALPDGELAGHPASREQADQADHEGIDPRPRPDPSLFARRDSDGGPEGDEEDVEGDRHRSARKDSSPADPALHRKLIFHSNSINGCHLCSSSSDPRPKLLNTLHCGPLEVFSGCRIYGPPAVPAHGCAEASGVPKPTRLRPANPRAAETTEVVGRSGLEAAGALQGAGHAFSSGPWGVR